MGILGRYNADRAFRSSRVEDDPEVVSDLCAVEVRLDHEVVALLVVRQEDERVGADVAEFEGSVLSEQRLELVALFIGARVRLNDTIAVQYVAGNEQESAGCRVEEAKKAVFVLYRLEEVAFLVAERVGFNEPIMIVILIVGHKQELAVVLVAEQTEPLVVGGQNKCHVTPSLPHGLNAAEPCGWPRALFAPVPTSCGTCSTLPSSVHTSVVHH